MVWEKPPTNDGWEYREQIAPSESGRTVLDYLSTRHRHSSLEVWGERIAAGEVSLDGVSAAAGDRLRPGQVLRWRRPPWNEADVPLRFNVVHEDHDLLVVDKPSGLPTAPAGGFLAHTLLSLVRRRHPDASPMHRLGRGTSGLVAFGKTASARSALQAAWREVRVEKTYRALCSGVLPPEPVSIDVPIGPVEHLTLGTVHAASAHGRAARSEVMRAGVVGRNSIADVRIFTGRPHQIRIHLASIGHPLVGDPLYGEGGTPLPGTSALPGDLGYHLHAWRLAFAHPRSGLTMRFEAPLPEALRC